MSKQSQSHFTRKLREAKANLAANRHVRNLRALVVQHPAIKEAFNMLPPAQRADAWLSAAEYDTSVCIGVSLRGLPSFKAPALQRVIERFLTPEWTASTMDFTFTDNPNRDFKFTRVVPFTDEQNDAMARHPSARWLNAHGYTSMIPRSLSLSVSVYAYVKADSPTCRVVVTGVKEEVIRTETKAIVCD